MHHSRPAQRKGRGKGTERKGQVEAVVVVAVAMGGGERGGR